MSLAQFAPAKVNLFLHVGAPDGQGYHPLVSLMTFADVGDRLTFSPASGLEMDIRGPFAAGLSAGPDNLVLKAARALLARAGRPAAGARIVLDKQLPVAAGLGGGSADAGAALRLLDQAMRLGFASSQLEEIAASLGADGAACLRAQPVLAEGRGERLSPAPDWPPLPCVLVNPGAALSTAAVYGAYDQAGRFSPVTPPLLQRQADVAGVARVLAGLRNDLEAPAMRLEPQVGEVLAALRGAPEALLARMSGSGATCFALCADDVAARALALNLAAARPRWWIRPCRLG